MSGWGGLSRVAQYRASAVAVLVAARTLADARVYDTPLEPWTADDLPAIGVQSKMRRDPHSAAGTVPSFKVGCTLMVQGAVGFADPRLAFQSMDQLEQQILDALLLDPVWPGFVGPFGAIETSYHWERIGELFQGEVRHQFALTWFETYAPTPSTPLLAGGQPIGVNYATRLDIAPFDTLTEAELSSTGETLVAATYPNLQD